MPASSSWILCSRLLILTLLLPVVGCTGIFQDGLPDMVATFHRQASGPVLEVGVAETDITPVGEVYLGGFDPATISTDVHEPLKVRAMVLRVGEMKIAIVGVDNLGLQRDDVEWIKTGVVGFANGNVFLCSSHTHAGPDLIGLWGTWFYVSGRDRGYVGVVRAAVAEAVAKADETARPAMLSRGEAMVPAEGIIRNSNRRGLFDRRLTVLHAHEAGSGDPIGALLHVACHPEVLRRGNTLLSADFVGPLCDRWRDAGLGQAVFANGALGAMITPEPRDLEGMPVMVDALLATAERAAERAEPVVVDELEVRRRDLYMPMTSPGLLLGRTTMIIPRRAYRGMVRSSVGSIRIGSIEILCVPGEMEPTLAARIRQQTLKPDLLLFGLVDDELGYLMRERDARDPLFEYERLMSPVVDTGERVEDAVLGTR